MRPIDADALIEFCAERWIPLNIDAVNMQPTIQPEERTKERAETHACDLISRQAAIELIKNYCENGCDIAEDNWCPSCQREQFIKLLKALPPAQPEPSIPLSWIEEYIEQLRNARGIYSKLRVNIINRMMYEWNKEQKGVKRETD